LTGLLGCINTIGGLISSFARQQFAQSYLFRSAIAFLSIFGVLAHGDLHERITHISAELAKTPRNPVLLAKRAELHRQHQEWSEALADIRLVATLRNDPSDRILEAMILLESGKTRESKTVLDTILRDSPTHSVALVARAQAHAFLHDDLAAVKDYNAAAALISQPKPDLFLEQARCMVRAGDRAAAIEALEQGMARISRLPSLQRYALDLEVDLGRYDAALARLSALENGSQSRFDLMLLRGEILLKAKRADEAREIFAATLCAIESQPARMNPRLQAIRTTIRAHLQQL
jgi:predicted Zn-dependent protease